jgi:glycosyltransferase involved in cell wall biosynthesis
MLKKRGLTPPILIMGAGDDLDHWKRFVEQHGLTNVTLAGYVSGEDLWLRLRHAHALLFPIRNTLLNRSRCPSKTFAYAQAKRPIITSRVGELPFMLGEKPIWIESTPCAFADEMQRVMELDLPDVDYKIEHHTWGERADRLLKMLGISPTPAVPAAPQLRPHTS